MSETKNARYFEALMQERAQAVHDDLTRGKSLREQMEMEEELEEKTFMPRLLAEVARGLPEAHALIAALEQASAAPVEVIWVKNYPGYEFGQLGQGKYTRPGIFARLRAISFLDLGEDPAAWQEWLEAFEADPPLLGYR